MTLDAKRKFNSSLGLPDSHPFAHDFFHWFPEWETTMPLCFDIAEFSRFHESEGGWTLNGQKWGLTIQLIMQICAILSFTREAKQEVPETVVIHDTWYDMGEANR